MGGSPLRAFLSLPWVHKCNLGETYCSVWRWPLAREANMHQNKAEGNNNDEDYVVGGKRPRRE